MFVDSDDRWINNLQKVRRIYLFHYPVLSGCDFFEVPMTVDSDTHFA